MLLVGLLSGFVLPCLQLLSQTQHFVRRFGSLLRCVLLCLPLLLRYSILGLRLGLSITALAQIQQSVWWRSIISGLGYCSSGTCSDEGPDASAGVFYHAPCLPGLPLLAQLQYLTRRPGFLLGWVPLCAHYLAQVLCCCMQLFVLFNEGSLSGCVLLYLHLLAQTHI